MRKSRGQVFVISAVIFASLIFLVYTSSVGTNIEPESDTTKKYFESSLEQSSRAFNEGLESNYSLESVKRELYSFDRFVERSTESKGIDFGVSHLAVLPQKGEAVFINYRGSSETLELKINGSWTNTSVTTRQNIEETFTAGKTEVRLKLPDRNFDSNFNASTPSVVTLMKMETDDQTWINTEASAGLTADSGSVGDGSGDNAGPTASFTYSPSSPLVDETISFDGTDSSDPDSSISSYEWDWDNDGDYEGSGSNPDNIYSSSGDYTVKLRVTYSDGVTDTATDTLTVYEQLAISSLNPPNSSTTVSTTTDFNFTFNQQIEKGSGDFRLYNGSGDLVETVDVSNNDAGTASIITNSETDDTLRVDPSTELVGNTEYYWQADTGVVTDTGGNDWSGIDDSVTYNFTTESGTALDIIDDFEDGDLSEYSSNNYIEVSGEEVYEGDYALKSTPPSNTGYEIITSQSGLPNYIQKGDKWRFHQRMETGDASNNGMAFGVQDADNHYFAQISRTDESIAIFKEADGGAGALSTTSVNIESEKWYTMEVHWQNDDTINATLYDEDNWLASVEATDSTFADETGVGWHTSQLWSGSGTTIYFDYAGLK